MSIPRVEHGDVASLTAALDSAGCCVIERAVEPATMDAIARELDAHRSSGSVGASPFEGMSTRRTGSPLPRSATFRSIAMHPVVMAAGGYPESYRKGDRIDGLPKVIGVDGKIFHAGTAIDGNDVVTSGGRVLTVVGTGPTLLEAREHVYSNVRRVSFQGAHYRKDHSDRK